MTDEKRALWRYRVVPDDALFAVICIHDLTPDWWRVIARFGNKERADRYVEVEQMMVDDDALDTHLGWDGDELPAPVETLPPTPESSITVERITVRSSGNHVDDAVSADITKRLAGGESVRNVMASTGAAKNTVQVRRNALVETKELEPRRQGKPTLSPDEIEARVQEAWKAVQELDAEGGKIGYATVAERAGVPAGSVAPAIKALVDRGLIQVFAHGQIDATELRERGGIRVVKAPLPAYMPPAPEWLTVDLDRNIARAQGIKDVALTSNEAEFLYALAEKRGTVMSLERMITKVYGANEPETAENGISVLVGKVRKKLEGCPFEIINHRGRGFELLKRADVASEPPEPDLPEPEPEIENEVPPPGCILNAQECGDFRRCWAAGDSMREMAEQFNLTTIEVADVRKKLGLPSRTPA